MYEGSQMASFIQLGITLYAQKSFQLKTIDKNTNMMEAVYHKTLKTYGIVFTNLLSKQFLVSPFYKQ
jgi:hypothetical protein